MVKLVLLRHGESIWNRENKLTGWTDIDLSEKGIAQAKASSKVLKDGGYVFDVAYTSALKRAIRTLWIVLDELNLMWIPIHSSWKLNERNYGALQGLNKVDIATNHEVRKAIVSYDVAPLSSEIFSKKPHKNHPGYKGKVKNDIPLAESLKNTFKRVLTYWHDVIAPTVASGKKVLIVAHGNSLRALVKHFDNISDKEITAVKIPNGIPLIYELNADLEPIKKYYLGEPEEIKKAMESVFELPNTAD